MTSHQVPHQLRRYELVGIILLFWGTAARADLIRDIAFGLGQANFNIAGQRNVLSGGVDLVINHNFQGNPLDFGIGGLTLSGPVSLQVSTGRRVLDTARISLTTALSRDQIPTPLQYALNTDLGGQTANVSGSLFMDVDLQLNGLGFYDVSLTYSSRQNIDREGLVSTGNETNDLDIGPINVRGNIVFDLLTLITNPLFEAGGQENPFAALSGSDQLRRILDDGSPAAGSPVALRVRADRILPFSPPAGTYFQDSSGLNHARNHGDIPVGAIVPEPAVIILLLVGAPFLLARSLGRRR